MSTQHTQGPWTYHLEADGEYLKIIGANGEVIVDGCGCCSSPWCRNEADARLMAVAPELLQFAELVVKGLESGNIKAKPVFVPDFDGSQMTLGSLLDLGRKVIVKATGGAA